MFGHGRSTMCNLAAPLNDRRSNWKGRRSKWSVTGLKTTGWRETVPVRRQNHVKMVCGLVVSLGTDWNDLHNQGVCDQNVFKSTDVVEAACKIWYSFSRCQENLGTLSGYECQTILWVNFRKVAVNNNCGRKSYLLASFRLMKMDINKTVGWWKHCFACSHTLCSLTT